MSEQKYENRVNRNYRNVIFRGSISFVYIRILKGEYKMSNVTIQKRGKYYQYKTVNKFENNIISSQQVNHTS